MVLPPPTTAHGALLAHITGGHIETIDAGPRSYQPMNVNFGLFPPLPAGTPLRDDEGRRLRGSAKSLAKKRALCRRAIEDGIGELIVYRARPTVNPRPESEALVETTVDPAELLADLRAHPGEATALGIPAGPNSGISVRLP